MANKLTQIVKDSFTKDIGYQPFIDGFTAVFPRMNLGQLKIYWDLVDGKMNPSNLSKYTQSTADYYGNRCESKDISKAIKIWETSQRALGAICAVPLNLATWAATSILLPGAIVAYGYNKLRAYMKKEEIEEEGLTFPSHDMRL